MPQAVKALAAPAAAADGAFGPVPDEASLALIHRYTLAELPASSLYVRRMVLANDALDRTFERFPVEYLQRFAATLPGKSLLVAHDKTALATGLIYRAEVRAARPGEAGRHSLVASFYLPVTSGNEEVRALIDAGVIRHVSIGFTYDQRLCSVCGQDYFCCPHLPGETAEDGQLVTYTYGGDPARVEAREASLVYLGAQREAVITKGDGNAFRQD